MPKRIVLACFAVALAMLASPPLTAADDGGRFPDTISLPNGFRPEGITIGRGTTIYVGSIPTGAIFQADLATGRGSLLVPPQPGRAATGTSFDPRTNLIYVCGGPTGAAYVYDAGTGATVAVFQLTTVTPTFINDEIITRDAVYFTDSRQAVLFKIPLSAGGRLAPDAAVVPIPLTGDFVQVPGVNNANGIEATANGKSLIVVHSTLGTLYRVDPDTGDARLIDLGGVSVVNGDGILLRGNRLFVVQNRNNQIAQIKLDHRLETGELERLITNPRFDVPTTIDDFHGRLYVVNARFTTPPTADTTYTIEQVGNRDDDDDNDNDD